MEKCSQERARRRFKRLDAWMHDVRSVVVYEHIVKILEALHDSYRS